MQIPEWPGADRWFQMIEDTDPFLSKWDRTACDLGWTALDLFGVHSVAPGGRYDVMGLVMLLGGGTVFALTEQTAALRRPSGSTLTYRRREVLAWRRRQREPASRKPRSEIGAPSMVSGVVSEAAFGLSAR
jgi:hypothetical protein